LISPILLLDLLCIPLKVCQVDFFLFLFFVKVSEGSADEIPVFYQNIAVSLEEVASFVSPSIQKI
jgi:hypothetical protein